jgi:energy-coupling factor transporter ATP-binding protein EcfA2
MSADDSTGSAPVLRTEHLGRKVEGKTIVGDVSVEAWHGEVLGIVGPSGSGKSSFLRLLNRLQHHFYHRAVCGGGQPERLPPERPPRRYPLYGLAGAGDQGQMLAVESLHPLYDGGRDLLGRHLHAELLMHVAGPLDRAHPHHLLRGAPAPAAAAVLR